ncbi:hypothetical protein [Bartonella sp. CB189]|uniref:hypothetical protein n=1 Tax=Bartonella sp. CB189 TaxID=3112254 RepID=UPI002F969C2F
MQNLSSIQSGFLENLSQKIDFFLGTFHREQIVMLSYMLSAIFLLCFIGYILCKGIHQKKILWELKEKNCLDEKRYNDNCSPEI